MQALVRTSQYFAKQRIPFPKIDLSNVKDEDLKECYVFEDAEDSRAPIVIFFPLINDSFRTYKAPGKVSRLLIIIVSLYMSNTIAVFSSLRRV